MSPETNDFETRARSRVASLGSELDLDTFAAAFNLFRASSRVMQDFELHAHRARQLSLAGFRVLFTIWTLGEMEPRELARHSGVSRAAISGTVATLERAGLVDKSKDQPDRRLVTVRLTEAGRDRLEDAYRAQNQREQLLFAALSPDDLDNLTRLLRLLIEGSKTR